MALLLGGRPRPGALLIQVRGLHDRRIRLRGGIVGRRDHSLGVVGSRGQVATGPTQPLHQNIAFHGTCSRYLLATGMGPCSRSLLSHVIGALGVDE